MTWVTGLVAGWNKLWFAPASPYPIAAFRILLGLYLLIYFGGLAPHVPTLFSSDGVYMPYLVPDYAPGPVGAWIAFAALYGLCIAMTLGIRTNVVIPCLIAVYLYHYFLALAIKHSSFERLIVIYLLALAPSNADAVWSICTKQAPRRVETSAFAGRLVRFQTVILYLGAGLWKAINPEWRSGALLFYTMHGIWATPLAFAITRLQLSAFEWSVLSRAVIAGELVLAVLLTARRTRPMGVVLTTLFHLGNTLILYIPEFLVCITPLVFFLSETTVERAGTRLGRWARTLAALLTRRNRASA